nr:head-tail adaptor protein [Streptomyces typhae]
MNTRVQVWRHVTVDDEGGGQDTTWVVQSTQRARLSQPSARERQTADQAEADLTHIVYLLPGADVRRGDELRRTAGPALEVTAVFEPSEPGTYLRADCAARQHQ